MAAGWTTAATTALLGMCGEENVQGQLDSVKRNRSIYEKISSKLSEQGHQYSWQQCRTKIKNFTQRYRKIKDGNRVSGTDRKSCPFYEEVDKILGCRAASQPPVLLDGTNGIVNLSKDIYDEGATNESSVAIGETSSEPVTDDTDLAACDNVTSVDSAVDSMTSSGNRPSNKRKLNGTATADIFEKFIKILPKKRRRKRRKMNTVGAKENGSRRETRATAFFHVEGFNVYDPSVSISSSAKL